MNCIVTGGVGYIGSNLVKQLIDLNYNVIVIDNNTSNFANNTKVGAVQYVYLNLCDFKSILELFENIDIVFHLASDVSISYCVDHPRESSTNNVIATINVLEACRIKNVKKIVFSSTSAIYSDTIDNIPISENHTILGKNTYSISKIYGEHLCKVYSSLYGIESTVLRYFNVFGKNYNVSKYSSVLVKFFDRYKQNLPLEIYGGNQTRDFIHVDDIVSSNIAASLNSENIFSAYNVGYGKSHTISNIANSISKNTVLLPRKEEDIQFSCCDNTKIVKELNWTPRYDVLNYINEEKDRIDNNRY